MSEKIYQFNVVCQPEFPAVCGLLGEGRTDVTEIKRIFETELPQLRGRILPIALMSEVSIHTSVEAGKDLLCKGMIGETADHNHADTVDALAVLLTVGTAGEQYVRELFAQGEHLRALVADAMLSAWLFAMDEKVQTKIRAFCVGQGVGVAKRLEIPRDLSPEMQEQICEVLDANGLADVHVTDAYMLMPEKSMCYLLELTGDCDRFEAVHDCEKCKKKDCGMRKTICSPQNIEKMVTIQNRSERNRVDRENMIQECKNPIVEDDFHGFLHRNCEGTEQLQQMKDSVDNRTKNRMIKILVEDQGKKIGCEAESVLIDALREHGVRIDAPCGGGGRCGKCRVRVMGGELPVTAEDRRFLSGREIATGVRLACTARPVSDLRIRVLAKTGKQMAAVAEMRDVVESNGNMQKNNGDGIKTGETAAEKHGFFAKDENGYGIGIDIGTTTLAACLYGWSDGVVRKTVTAVNSGRDFGADVLSRMEASCHGKRSRLQELLQEDLRGLIAQLLTQSGVLAEDVQKIVIAANMTMVHLLMGYSCETLGRAPFVPANKRMICADCMRILGDSQLRCPVIILPALSAFVGGDIVSGMLATGMDHGEETVLLLDIGTNGEMALRHHGQVYVTSTAAGPAFEGGGISCGCASVPGAICGVKLADDQPDRTVSPTGGRSGGYQKESMMIRTIGDTAPVGICGSGVLELVSELLRVGLLDATGLFAEEYRANGFLLGNIASGEQIVFTQGDVRALQLAKGAIRAGIEALLAAASVREEEVSQVYLAGGFGVRMDEQAAIHIGLLPEAFRGRIRPMGNSSLSGAVFAGRMDGLEAACEDLVAQCKQVMLAEQPEFEENYLRYMNF